MSRETPLEMAQRRQKEKTCATCKDRTVIGGASYCEKDGKMLHPMLLENPYGPCPIEQEVNNVGYMDAKAGELKDEKVVKDLLRAADLYQDGCISEVQSILRGIVRAIDDFGKVHDKAMRSGRQ